MQVKFDRICFIDSLSFQMPLFAFPKTFGLTELKKAYMYFPHLFNTQVNQDYEGAIPDQHYDMPISERR